MRILIDARSVRTPAGSQIFRGLCRGWLHDPRVDAVIAAIPRGFTESEVPHDVEPLRVASNNWASHLLTDLPRAADRTRADIIFCPNGVGPADTRAVVYLQDMFHFVFKAASNSAARIAVQRAVRAGIRALSHPYHRVAIAVSPAIALAAESRFRVPIEIVPNGVDVSDLLWHGGGASVLVLGGIGARKDEGTALNAWAAIERPDGIMLTLVGVEPKQRRARLRLMARDLGIGKSVVIRGMLSRGPYLKELARCVVSISCSRLEAFSLPVAEALMMNAPIVCSDIPAHLDLIARAGAGRIFPQRDSAALGAIISEALHGVLPPRTGGPVPGWDWHSRAAQQIDIFERYVLDPLVAKDHRKASMRRSGS
ncbi:MAG TPA: glycosyltransferase [Gemmatimonadaceae bacterium]|nr:glycosyltransferase [Gemmatimonadaceae bacterium]